MLVDITLPMMIGLNKLLLQLLDFLFWFLAVSLIQPYFILCLEVFIIISILFDYFYKLIETIQSFRTPSTISTKCSCPLSSHNCCSAMIVVFVYHYSEWICMFGTFTVLISTRFLVLFWSIIIINLTCSTLLLCKKMK